MCGIVGIRDAGGISFSLYYALYALQHRGQESAGISTFDGTRLYKHKGQGLVAEVFDPAILEGLLGNVGIGHVRYPTTGGNRQRMLSHSIFSSEITSSQSLTMATSSMTGNSGTTMNAGARSSARQRIPS
jgi:glutamine phosphoribosylpyrophosphate amidotransferase